MSLLIALDFETTGLDPAAGAEPIELAVVVLTDDFRELGSAEWLIKPSDAADWDLPALTMHLALRQGLPGGLAALCTRWGRGRGEVGADLEAWLSLFKDRGPLHLLGNSIHFNRGFLRHYWPNVEQMFHHRHLDVSSVRMLGERVTGRPPTPGEAPHRAMADVRRSIAELKYWTDALRGAP